MRSEVTYQSERTGYVLAVIKYTAGAVNTYTAMLTNTTTGATQQVPGWRNRPDAIDYVRRMYDAKLI